ncbi:hypothetical protein E4N62_09570 [Streptomyces sp. MNU76]|nr:hypothetical protein [Streptomyces sp. MNU76]MCC9705490.1 hypothetical protein [Streptomyces sp. MNU76]
MSRRRRTQGHHHQVPPARRDTGTGEIRNGFAHLHVVMGAEGDRAIVGHLHEAVIGTHFARVYVIPVT